MLAIASHNNPNTNRLPNAILPTCRYRFQMLGVISVFCIARITLVSPKESSNYLNYNFNLLNPKKMQKYGRLPMAIRIYSSNANHTDQDHLETNE